MGGGLRLLMWLLKRRAPLRKPRANNRAGGSHLTAPVWIWGAQAQVAPCAAGILQARLQNPEPQKPGFTVETAKGRTRSARRRRSLCGTELRGHREFIAVPPAPGQPLHLLQPLQLNHCPGLGRKKSPVTLEEQGHSKGGAMPSVRSAEPLLHPAPELCSCPA